MRLLMLTFGAVVAACSPQIQPVMPGESDPCAMESCSGHGQCAIVNGATAVCLCDAGFRADGTSCLPIVAGAECSGVTCSERGTCVVVEGPPRTPLCQCDPGHRAVGTTCVPVVDPCANVTCGGQGTCAVAGAAAVCVCNAGFRASGSTCEPIVSGQECAGVTCSGHGRCVVVQGMPNEPLCQCDAGYQVMGRTSCVAPADPCMNVDCNTGGTCAVAGGTAVCACGPGFQPSGRTRCVPLAAGDGGVCPAGNLVRNADFSLPAPWLKPLRPEFQVVQGRPDSNNHSTMVGNPPPAARLGSVGGTGGLRLGGHQCLLAPPSCFTNVTVAIDAKEDVLGSSSTGYACTIRVAGYAAADCAGAASAFVDLPTSGGVTSVSTWRTLTASGAIPPAVRSAVSVDVQVFCTGPNAFLGNSLIIDNPSIAFVP